MENKNNVTINAQDEQQSTEQVNLKFVETMVSEAVTQPTAEEQQRQERLTYLRGLRVTTKTVIEPEQYVLSVDGVGFFAIDDVHGLKSKQKAGKTSVLKVCAAALMNGQLFRLKSELEKSRVLWLDTEQKPSDVKAIIDDVCLLSGKDADYIDEHLRLFQLRRLNYETLLTDTRLFIEDNHPQVVFIDGVVEYVASFNDEQKSRQLINDLMMMAGENHCAIVCVLHENKAADDENMRGHLGTVLAQKAGTVLQCQKGKTGIISVGCPDSRHGQMPTWNIVFDSAGNISDADEQHRKELELRQMKKKERQKAKSERLMKERSEIALAIINDNGGSISRSELTIALEERLKLNRSTVSTLITRMIDKVLQKSGDNIVPISKYVQEI